MIVTHDAEGVIRDAVGIVWPHAQDPSRRFECIPAYHWLAVRGEIPTVLLCGEYPRLQCIKTRGHDEFDWLRECNFR